MSTQITSKRIRWLARIWSLLILTFTVVRIFTPDPYATEPVPFEDWFLLSLWGIAILGVLVAWKWETTGAIITIGTLFFREAAWLVIKGRWIPNFLIIWVLLVPPVILFLVARRMERKTLPLHRVNH